MPKRLCLKQKACDAKRSGVLKGSENWNVKPNFDIIWNVTVVQCRVCRDKPEQSCTCYTSRVSMTKSSDGRGVFKSICMRWSMHCLNKWFYATLGLRLVVVYTVVSKRQCFFCFFNVYYRLHQNNNFSVQLNYSPWQQHSSWWSMSQICLFD